MISTHKPARRRRNLLMPIDDDSLIKLPFAIINIFYAAMIIFFNVALK